MITDFGFDWGDVAVVRTAEFKGMKCLTISCNGNEVSVYVSPTGRSIRVFDRKSRELKPKAGKR
jgi:hypothetical protein